MNSWWLTDRFATIYSLRIYRVDMLLFCDLCWMVSLENGNDTHCSAHPVPLKREHNQASKIKRKRLRAHSTIKTVLRCLTDGPNIVDTLNSTCSEVKCNCISLHTSKVMHFSFICINACMMLQPCDLLSNNFKPWEHLSAPCFPFGLYLPI